MDKQKLNKFRSLLRQEKALHDNVLNDMKKHDRGEQDRYSTESSFSGELSNYDNHPAELGSELFELEHNMGLEVSEEYKIKEVHDAFLRMKQGIYGICELCGKNIDEARLEVIPSTRLCIDCEEDKTINTESLMKDRPNEEYILNSPFGRKYLNKQEDDEHEGMDQLHDLMKYGSADTPQDMGGYHEYEEYYTNDIDDQGIVDPIENISNQDYKNQLPD